MIRLEKPIPPYIFKVHFCRSSTSQALNPGRVKHDADSLADGLGGEVLGELGSNGAASAMGTRHFAPNDLGRGERDHLTCLCKMRYTSDARFF